MAGIVLDSSVVMAWLLEEQSALANRAVKTAFESVAHLPTIWAYEVQNVLTIATRRGRLTLDDAREASDVLASIPARMHQPHSLGREFAVATPSGLTAYDAAYLCVAKDLQTPLATLDRALREAAYALGVQLFE